MAVYVYGGVHDLATDLIQPLAIRTRHSAFSASFAHSASITWIEPPDRVPRGAETAIILGFPRPPFSPYISAI
jgi:hypothetical protein